MQNAFGQSGSAFPAIRERKKFPIMETQLAGLKRHMADGDHRAALRLAALWSRLGDHSAAIRRGWAAASNPEFYRAIGQHPAALILAGLDAIRERYRI